VVWPDSKTGGISKPMSEEAYRLLSTAPRREGCPYVLPSPNDPAKHLTFGEHYGGWTRVLKAAGVPHVGTHGIRHRSTTDIANSGVPTKVGMKLTGHKTVAMFMHYVHTEDKPVRDAAELVASRRQAITGRYAVVGLCAADFGQGCPRDRRPASRPVGSDCRAGVTTIGRAIPSV
jgi:integrase